MKNPQSVTILLAIMLLTPAAAFAFSVEDMIDAARAGHGTVVESHSSANTGGQTAASGQTMTTGDSSVSSHTETRINANGSGGTVEVKIQKTENGVTTKKTYEKKVAPDEPVVVQTNASAGGREASESTVEINGELQTSETFEETADEQAGFEFGSFFTASVPNFFKKIAGFFSWF